MLGFSIINAENTNYSTAEKYKRAEQFLKEHPQRIIRDPVPVSEVQDVTEEPPQTISPVQTLPQAQSYVQTVPQTQSYVQYVPVVTKPDYKKIILVGGGIILFAILLKKVIR